MNQTFTNTYDCKCPVKQHAYKCTLTWRGAAAEYAKSFLPVDCSEDFLTYYSIKTTEAGKQILTDKLTRQDFLDETFHAYKLLKTVYGVKPGDFVCHYFSDNQAQDLFFRFAEILLGVKTVTINWAADTVERIEYKVRLVEKCNLVLVDPNTDKDKINVLRSKIPSLQFHLCGEKNQWASDPRLSSGDMEIETESCDVDTSRMIIFTSGTTGQPKGVKLTFGNYETNRKTFDDFLQLTDSELVFKAVVVNPLHHANSTSITDLALRRPGSQIHLFQRYTSQYWNTISKLGTSVESNSRIVAPCVSRHFDFLANLNLEESILKGLFNIDFLIGSAPVGPKTISNLLKFAGKIPIVRFGSTETCLQVMGTMRSLSEEERMTLFKKGWEHKFNGEKSPGYYIGEAHRDNTEVAIVKSVKQESPDFMLCTKEGEPGYIITRGGNVMAGYVGNKEATAKALIHETIRFPDDDNEKFESFKLHSLPWYVNLGDVGFWLKHKSSKGESHIAHFWMSRESELLIVGGTNYSCAQINDDLKRFLISHYALNENDVTVGTVGLKVNSEHEDQCLVTIELSDSVPADIRTQIEQRFEKDSREAVSKGILSKGAKPSHVRFDKVPKNFKGAILVKEMKKIWSEKLNL